jgi:hypothetical protein
MNILAQKPVTHLPTRNTHECGFAPSRRGGLCHKVFLALNHVDCPVDPGVSMCSCLASSTNARDSGDLPFHSDLSFPSLHAPQGVYHVLPVPPRIVIIPVEVDVECIDAHVHKLRFLQPLATQSSTQLVVRCPLRARAFSLLHCATRPRYCRAEGPWMV